MIMATATKGSTSASTWLKRIIICLILIAIVTNPTEAVVSVHNILGWIKGVAVGTGHWLAGVFAP